MPLNEESLVARVALRHSISPEAVRTILLALRSGGGSMGQFSHPEFGGMSQWSPGMTMVGDMFNNSLKSKLDAVCTELAGYAAETQENDRRRDGDYSTLDKMSVSRAVAALETKDCLTREEDPADRRNKILRLTPAGRTLYQKIVPLARARERHILEALTATEHSALDVIMKKLLAQARGLRERG